MTAAFYSTCFVLLVALLLYLTGRVASGGSSNFPLPPGPKSLPLLGAALSIDSSKPWVTYLQWRKLFGDLIYTRIFNLNVLIINSAKATRDLVELRPNIYSDRPSFATAEPYGIADGTILMPYGDTWRLHRRIYHQAFNTAAAKSYHSMQCSKSRQLIINLVDDPRNFLTHLHAYSTSIIMSIVYGYETEPTNDPWVEYVEKGLKVLTKATDPKRAALLQIFPFLLKLPAWVPGTFKLEAAEARYYATGFRKVLFTMALERMASGTDAPSMISGAVSRNERNGNSPEVTLAIRNTSAVAYGAGSETTSATLGVFVLAMVLFPEVQKRAQKEIDLVVGSERLPDFNDRTSMPFVEAVLRETLRWYPVVPLGLPHATTTEDVYEGSYIPKGTTVFVNLWSLAHDEEIYPDPFEFRPERYIKEDGTLKESVSPFGFGFGRRICPGRHVADASLWIAIALMLATMEFLEERDDHGNIVNISPAFTVGGVSRPEPFPCRIVPRMAPSAIKALTVQDH